MSNISRLFTVTAISDRRPSYRSIVSKRSDAASGHIVAGKVLFFGAAADEATVGVALGYARHTAHLWARFFGAADGRYQ